MPQAFHDATLMWLFGAVLFALIIFNSAGSILKNRRRRETVRSTIDTLNARIRAWWKMCIIFGLSILLGRIGALVVFAAISFLAMREYMTLVPTRRGDHRT